MGVIAIHSSADVLAALERVRQAMNSLSLAMVPLGTLQQRAMREQEDEDSSRGPDYNPWARPELRAAQGEVMELRQRCFDEIKTAER